MFPLLPISLYLQHFPIPLTTSELDLITDTLTSPPTPTSPQPPILTNPRILLSFHLTGIRDWDYIVEWDSGDRAERSPEEERGSVGVDRNDKRNA